jgi:hypothetical protein
MKPASRHPPTHTTSRSPVPHPIDVHPHSTTSRIREENVLHELSTRVARSVEICKSRKRFAKLEDEELWRKHSRACIETTALLHFCANAKLAWFGDITELFGNIGSSEKIRELSLAGTDQLFVTCWTCLSLVAIRQIMEDNQVVQFWVRSAMESFTKQDDTDNDDTLGIAQKIDKILQKASDCLFRLYSALANTKDLTEVKEILRGHESQISELEQINIEADRLGLVDYWIFAVRSVINFNSHQIIPQIPGVLDDFNLHVEAPIPFTRLVEPSRDPRKL